MANVGKLLASAVSLNTEVQASLASFNFDFSLLKVEAPAEYAGVGSSLTKLRRRDAEDGTSHITARKLAALFADEIPLTKSLFTAYGHRATEISAATKSNSDNIARHGAFADHAGTDGTTIWAAATSGREALAIHLLACLLARIWAADEAVAVWLQLIQERKERLQEQISSGTFQSSALFASKLELSRPQLAAWDSNTRAWLSTADQVKRKEQTQLRLVIDNISLPVNPARTVYESVMQTWITSMKMMEDLLNGKSLSIQNGELLLGLSSWHIYPNLSVITDQITQIMQRDALIPEHVLVTVGLISKSHESDSGIHWSLPLAHLRFYGKPVVRTRHSGLGDSRVPFNDLLYVVLGSIFRTWQKNDADFSSSMALLCLIIDNLFRIEKPVVPWFAPLDYACRRYSCLSEDDRVVAFRLIRLGYRYSKSFLASEIEQPPAAFGLTDLRYLLRVCSTTDSRIKLLRYWARKNLKNLGKAVIRYYLPASRVERFTIVDISERKRKRDHDEADLTQHWTNQITKMDRIVRLDKSLRASLDDPLSWSSTPQPDRQPESASAGQDADSAPLADWIKQEFLRNTANLDKDQLALEREIQFKIKELQDDIASSTRNKTQIDHSTMSQTLPSLGFENDGGDDLDRTEDESEVVWLPDAAGVHHLRPYRYKAGIMDLAAVFVPIWDDSAVRRPNSLTCDQLDQFLAFQVTGHRSAFISEVLARHTWRPLFEKHFPSYTASLRALNWAYELYQHLPDASVDLRVRLNPLHEAFYCTEEMGHGLIAPETTNKLRQIFSCVTLFETGSINIPPTEFESTMAICYKDSIYVAHRLLQDPSEDDPPCLVTRIVGNIGKPGLSILHPPLAPEVRTFDADTSWYLASYQPFEGKCEDNFSSTSLHLSFTGSSVAHGTKGSSEIHQEVSFVETLIQAYDKGRWIADLDVLAARRQVQHGWPGLIKEEGQPIHSDLCILDSWDELLGIPPGPAIFRAHGNWMARLAAVTILAQQQREFSIIPCSESIPEIKPHSAKTEKISLERQKADRDAQQTLELSGDFDDHGTPAAQTPTFEGLLSGEIGNMEDCDFLDRAGELSEDSEIDLDSPLKDEDEGQNYAEMTPRESPDATSSKSADGGSAVILIC